MDAIRTHIHSRRPPIIELIRHLGRAPGARDHHRARRQVPARGDGRRLPHPPPRQRLQPDALPRPGAALPAVRFLDFGFWFGDEDGLLQRVHTQGFSHTTYTTTSSTNKTTGTSTPSTPSSPTPKPPKHPHPPSPPPRRRRRRQQRQQRRGRRRRARGPPLLAPRARGRRRPRQQRPPPPRHRVREKSRRSRKRHCLVC